MIFNFEPRDPSELNDPDVVALAAQVDVLQTFVVAMAIGYGEVINAATGANIDLPDEILDMVDGLSLGTSIAVSPSETPDEIAEAQLVAASYERGFDAARASLKQVFAPMADALRAAAPE